MKRAYNLKYGICILVFALIMSQAGITIIRENTIKETPKSNTEINQNNIMIKDHDIQKTYIIKKQKSEEFKITAYDLSKRCTGKSRGSSGYGITTDGTNLKGHTWKSARSISVDPKIIPLGSKVELKFTETEYKIYDGIYVCNDTGSAIKGNKIDLFLGDFNSNQANKETINFGVAHANVTILDN